METVNELTYSVALERLKEIVGQLELGDATVDELVEVVKEAQNLVLFCRARLKNVSGEVSHVLDSMKS
jgi:exodeoxyribonuclease VII small subunit